VASQPTSREIVRVLAALSDENRFRIVELLAERNDELSCGTIGDALDISPSLLSHHLAILADAGIIGRRKNGLWTMNALQESVIARQLEVLGRLIRNGAGGAPGATGNGAPPSDPGGNTDAPRT
jgi:DNA-binding transcriptional ArsR family regulator